MSNGGNGDARDTNREGSLPDDPRHDGLDRRGFLIGAGGLTGAAAFEAVAFAAKQNATAVSKVAPVAVNLAQQIGVIAKHGLPEFRILVRRREDLLFLRIDFYNLVRDGQFVKRKNTKRHAFLVIEHVPQHLTEQAYNLPGGTPKAPGKSKALLAYPSRLAFLVPANVHKIPFTLAGLLDWAALEPSLAPAAAEPESLIVLQAARAKVTNPGSTPSKPAPINVRKAPKLRAATPTETAIELPWRLVISPLSNSHWSHPTALRTLNDWTELWHTRLAASADETAPDGGPFRAIWNYDVDTQRRNRPTLTEKIPADNNQPFLTSLDSRDRYQIVRASSDFTIPGRADVQAAKMWLSARGGFLDSIGVWDIPSTNKAKLDIEEWKHLATLGRDHYVKVVVKGFLYPFGHRAVLVKVTERRFEAVGSEIVATSRQKKYLVVRQPDKSYDPADTFGVANDSRDFPFRNLHLVTLRTPDLDLPAVQFVKAPVQAGEKLPDDAFVPIVNKTPFLWHFIGTDWVGRQIPFTAPAVFVSEFDGLDGKPSKAVRRVYNALPAGSNLNVGQFDGRAVAFGASDKQGDTDLETHTITFGVGDGTGGTDAQFEAHDQPQAYPNVVNAVVRLTAAEQASGGQPLATTPIVAYHDTYVSDGFYTPSAPANKGNVFMALLPANQPGVNFGGGSAGGVMTPNLTVSGLSRSLGPIAGDIKMIAGGTFDPKSVFADVEAKILGGVNLIDLIKKVVFPDDQPGDNVMKITYDTTGGVLTTHLMWTPEINSDNPVISMTNADGTGFKFELDGLVTTDPLHPENSTFKVTGDLEEFTVTLVNTTVSGAAFIAILFNKLTFVAAKGQKSDVKVDVDTVNFLGVLEFVEQLEDLMNFSGDGGPKIEVLPTGINADLSVPIPDIAVGIFALTNIAIDAGFSLPFDGSPARVRFSFSTQDNPFGLSVAIFGGGGFFGIAIGTDGVELIQASLDFGAMCSINLGVASGSVHLLAGIYFSYGDNGNGVDTCVLSGFVKLGGSLSILGIITLSLEFDMSITYQTPPSEVTGTATLSVSVSILFLSFSVSVTASKTFGGGSDGTNIQIAHHSGTVTRALGGSDVPPSFVAQVPPDAPGGTTSAIWDAYCAAFAGN